MNYGLNGMVIAKRTNPKLWERIVNSVKAGDKGGKKGQWSARKAQLAVKRYKDAGGGYSSSSPPRKKTDLKKWGDEDWQTSDGKKAQRKDQSGRTVTKRYLPKKAWDEMTPEQKKATNRKKTEGSRKGKQFVKNTKKAARASKKARNQ